MAISTIGTNLITDGTIATADIADDAVTSAKLDTNIDIAGTLDVTGVLTADNNATIAGDLTVDTSTLKVDSTNNRVGIGTTSPSTPLHVKTDSSGYALTIEENSGGEAYQIGTDSYGGLNFYNSTTKTVEFTDSGDVQILDSGTVKIKLDPNSDSYFNGGSLGIGTTSPTTALHVYSNDGIEQGLTITQNTDDSNSGALLRLYNSSATAAMIRFGANHSSKANELFITNVGTNSPMTFATQDTERMRIDSSGNVGIGTTNPSANLHLYDTDSDKPHLLLENFGNRGTGDAPILEFYLNDETTGGIGDDTQVGVITFAGDEKDGGTKETYGQIRGIAHDPGSGSSNKGNIDFMVQSAGSLHQTMCLDEKNVGIGTGTPEQKLHLSVGGGSSVRMRLSAGSYGNANIGMDETGLNIATDGSQANTYGNINLVPSGSGYVGISNTDPSAKLHIASASSVGNQTDPAIQIGGAGNYRLGIYTTSEGAVFDNKNGDDGLIFNVKTIGEAMRILPSGFVGIGDPAANDGEKFKVENSGTCAATIYANEDSSARDAILRLQTRNGSAQSKIVWLYGDGAGTYNGEIQHDYSEDSTSFVVPNTKSNSAGAFMYIGRTNEGSNYSGLQVFQIGGASAADRKWKFQTIEQGVSNSGDLVFQQSGGLVGIGTDNPVAKLTVDGSFSKSSGSFRIPHPLPALNDTKDLVHSFIEGPQADLIYRGTVDLVNGSATVNIDTVAGMTDGTFVALCREVQCFTTNEDNWDLVKASVSGNILTIQSQNSSSTATISWLVIGERKDPHMYDTEWTDSEGKIIIEPNQRK